MIYILIFLVFINLINLIFLLSLINFIIKTIEVFSNKKVEKEVKKEAIESGLLDI